MRLNRTSGILLHITSLPGPHGIGDLGPAARRFADFLHEAGCSVWQVLPLGPTGFGDSPYATFSAFAGNPYLISPEDLLVEGLLTEADLADRPAFPAGRVDYGAVIPYKLRLLDQAYRRFREGVRPDLETAFADFRRAEAAWLDDFALFMALKEAHQGAPWNAWPAPLRHRDPAALEQARHDLAEAIEKQAFRQFLFFRQWRGLLEYAHARRVYFMGDVPIFVAYDSADVWAHPELFYLDAEGQPTVVAGVPPDYFSPTGQRWGNPLYRWEVHREQGYAWWLARLRQATRMVDLIRLDHFRGFAGYWEVPAEEPTAVNGRWRPGPGEDFFRAVFRELGHIPLIAEDLGEITPDVLALRDAFGLPGMKILVFAFDSGPDNPFLPHHYTPNFVVYTGTHDNDTVVGWWRRVDETERDFCRRYLATRGQDIAWDLIRAAWASVAVLAIAPMQDFLRLDNRARMNYPGREGSNWAWRMPAEALKPELRDALRELNILYSRGKVFGE
ncbi:MAG TPA: 4-alpha-glucanotransferase [Anaerolineae bacterium]|nr:4-alpha-glucanotransferase [Anaerolineae bacterium]HIQ09705.1 4-alpha-glucanotransferase [Anaerolineaceae bacterium]